MNKEIARMIWNLLLSFVDLLIMLFLTGGSLYVLWTVDLDSWHIIVLVMVYLSAMSVLSRKRG